MRSDANRIARRSQYTDDIQGWLFDGADGSQVALWECHADRTSDEHIHAFDEWVFVLEGRVTAVIDGRRLDLAAGDELLVPKGTKQSMAVTAGTRTMHVFGGRRARREADASP